MIQGVDLHLFCYDLFDEGYMFVNTQGGLFGVDKLSQFYLVSSLIKGCIVLILLYM